MNHLVERYKNEKRWVNYKLQTRKGKTTKVPYSPVTGKMASSTKTSDWSTYDEALAVSKDVGIVFTPEQNLLGIDIDKCLTDKKITHEQKEIIADLILEADTYTEISPSGTGIHLFLSISEKMPLFANRHANFECYTGGRYFTFTGIPYGETRDVRVVNREEAEKILAIIGYPWKKEEVKTTDELSPQTTKLLTVFSDADLLEKMFHSKNGDKVKAIYDGDLSSFDNDASRADASLCSSLAFWTGKDGVQMERIWLASPLGSREKTQKRKDYRERTINSAIANCKDVYVAPLDVSELELLFTLNAQKDKVYIQNTENICRILRKHTDFRGRFRYDAFKNMIEFKRNETWRALEDVDDIRIQTSISVLFTKYFGKVGAEMVHDAIVQVAFENEIDSAKDFMTSLKWDGHPRLDDWLFHTFGAPQDIYHKAVASNWLKGAVKRVMHPGCQFDYVLILEGPQGIRKSSSLAALGGDWHVETNMGTDNKDFFMQMLGKLFVEFSEGETLTRTEVKRMKGIITTRVDRYRPPYARSTMDFPRRCVFAMTTNQEEYLKDETGNRRYLPVKVLLPMANVKWIEDNRNQLFAEAYHRIITLGETMYEFPNAETLAQQQARMIQDPNADAVVMWYGKLNEEEREDGITTAMVFKDCFGGYYSGKAIDRLHEMIIANILKNSLGLKRERKSVNKQQCWRWVSDGSISFHKTEEKQMSTEEILTKPSQW